MLKLETPAIGARLIEYAGAWERSLAASAIESSADAALVARICTGRLADGKFTDDAYTAFNELCRKNAEPDDTAKKA